MITHSSPMRFEEMVLDLGVGTAARQVFEHIHLSVRKRVKSILVIPVFGFTDARKQPRRGGWVEQQFLVPNLFEKG